MALSRSRSLAAPIFPLPPSSPPVLALSAIISPSRESLIGIFIRSDCDKLSSLSPRETRPYLSRRVPATEYPRARLYDDNNEYQRSLSLLANYHLGRELLIRSPRVIVPYGRGGSRAPTNKFGMKRHELIANFSFRASRRLDSVRTWRFKFAPSRHPPRI